VTVVHFGPPHPSREKGKLPSFKERLAALRLVAPLVRMVWETHRGLTSAMIALRIVASFVPIASLWIGKLIIDGVVSASRQGGHWRDLLPLVLIEMGIVIGGEILSRASALTETILGDLFSHTVSIRLMRHAATLDLEQFENPEFYDHLERARQQTTNRVGLLSQIVGIGQSFITLITMSAALLAFSPWLLLLLIVVVLPGVIGEAHFGALTYHLMWKRAPDRRMLDYLRFVGASDRTAKEVQLFGLADWLIERYRVLSERFHKETRELGIRRAVVGILLSFVRVGGYYGAYLLMVARAIGGSISLGSLTFLAGTFSRGRDLVSNILLSASGIHEQSLYLRDLFVFFEMQPTIASRPGAPRVPRPIARGFVFDDVGFKYPGSERWAIRNVSFELHAGERLALVGENGAGKTTITKLLARLYDPTEGRILLDGIDLRDYDVASLRQAIGVIFQDFVRYDMRFDENVGVGEIEPVRSYLDDEAATGNGSTPTAIQAAAENSLAASLLPRFTGGYRQMLGRRFEGGVDLSGGEWQKIALARAYMRDAQVLILDEPTAALDARAEYEVFTRFAELMADRTAVLISHRFSTVRMADRIAVLKDGRVVEEGTHDELVSRGGLYGELFSMQAAGYR
jgi:ATP-binding cassette, subfamily B, bacterial